MTEERYRWFDLGIKLVAAVITLMGIWYGYVNFISEYERANRKPYVDLQLKVYSDLLETVAKITFPANDPEKNENIAKFWRIHEGIAGIVSDDRVYEEAASASDCIQKLEKRQCPQFELEARLNALAEAMRGSLLRSWNLKIAGESLLTTRSSAPAAPGAQRGR
jgi:hypothetical protein